MTTFYYSLLFPSLLYTRVSSPIIVGVGKGSIAHSRFRCGFGGGGKRGVISGGSVRRCMSLFIGCGLGIRTTLSTHCSALSSFGGRFHSCHSRRVHPCFISRRERRRRVEGCCSNVGGSVNPSNLISSTRVLMHLVRRTSTRRRTGTGTHVSSVCVILRRNNSFSALTGRYSSSRNSTRHNNRLK